MRYLKFLKYILLLGDWRSVLPLGELLLSVVIILYASLIQGDADEILARIKSQYLIALVALVMIADWGLALRSVMFHLSKTRRVFYKLFRLRTVDFAFLVVHRTFFAACACAYLFCSLLRCLGWNPAMMLFLPAYAVFVLSVIAAEKLYISVENHARRRTGSVKTASKLFGNKRNAFLMKDLQEMYRHPNLVCGLIFCAVCIFLLVRFHTNFLIGVYLLCTVQAFLVYDAYHAEQENQLLHSILRLTGFRFFAQKTFSILVRNSIVICLYLLIHFAMVGVGNALYLLMLPLLFLNAAAQSFCVGSFCVQQYPHLFVSAKLTSVIFLCAIPGLSIPLYIYSFHRMARLRTEEKNA
jgi:hypothetical protein